MFSQNFNHDHFIMTADTVNTNNNNALGQKENQENDCVISPRNCGSVRTKESFQSPLN